MKNHNDAVDANLVEMLRCPQDRSRIYLVEAPLLDRVNDAVRAGQLHNAGGVKLTEPLEAGLIREAGDLMYPVIDQIPVMLPDEAIALSQLG